MIYKWAWRQRSTEINCDSTLQWVTQDRALYVPSGHGEKINSQVFKGPAGSSAQRWRVHKGKEPVCSLHTSRCSLSKQLGQDFVEKWERTVVSEQSCAVSDENHLHLNQTQIYIKGIFISSHLLQNYKLHVFKSI